jgi:hypothetical protein
VARTIPTKNAVFASKKLNAMPVPGILRPNAVASQSSPAITKSTRYGSAAEMEYASGVVTSSQHEENNAASRNTGESHFNSL